MIIIVGSHLDRYCIPFINHHLLKNATNCGLTMTELFRLKFVSDLGKSVSLFTFHKLTLKKNATNLKKKKKKLFASGV